MLGDEKLTDTGCIHNIHCPCADLIKLEDEKHADTGCVHSILSQELHS